MSSLVLRRIRVSGGLTHLGGRKLSQALHVGKVSSSHHKERGHSCHGNMEKTGLIFFYYSFLFSPGTWWDCRSAAQPVWCCLVIGLRLYNNN